jgi:hypothetical protein
MAFTFWCEHSVCPTFVTLNVALSYFLERLLELRFLSCIFRDGALMLSYCGWHNI